MCLMRVERQYNPDCMLRCITDSDGQTVTNHRDAQRWTDAWDSYDRLCKQENSQ